MMLSTHLIDKTEIYFHKRASHGANIYGKKGEYDGKYFSYDGNSMYCYILSKKSIKIPIKGGKAYKLKKIDTEKTGIYKIKITSIVDPVKFKSLGDDYFYYTNWDIKALDMLKYNYELDNNDINAFVYEDDDCLSGKYLFNDYVKKLFDIKTNVCKDIKTVMSMLWGEPSSMKKDKINFCDMNKYNPKDFQSFDQSKGVVYLKDHHQPFNWTFARLTPFMLSSARYLISQIAVDVIDAGYDIIRIHTDSILTNCPPDVFTEIYEINPKKLGAMKIETDKCFDGKFTIEHVNSIFGKIN